LIMRITLYHPFVMRTRSIRTGNVKCATSGLLLPESPMSSAGPREYAGINDEIPTILSSHELISLLPRQRIIGSSADTYTSIDYATLELFFPQISGMPILKLMNWLCPYT
jgi:hypothetical protein